MTALFSASTSKSFFKAAHIARAVVNCFFLSIVFRRFGEAKKDVKKQKKIRRSKRRSGEAKEMERKKKIWRSKRRFEEAK
jgi:hypothetical protein